MKDITTTYRDIILEFYEDSYGNTQWMCDLFSKPAESLAKAKERIDKKLDTEKKEPFARFEAYVPSSNLRASDGLYQLVEVTSYTDDKAAWVNHKGNRTKISLWREDVRKILFMPTPDNVATISKINVAVDGIAKLRAQIETFNESMVPIKPKDE